MTANDFKLHDALSAPAVSADILASVQDQWGFIPNLHRVLAESPAALEVYQSLWQIVERTSLTPVERNAVYLAIIRENRCGYCMAGHTMMSRLAGLDEEQIDGLREGRPLDDPKLEALRHFASLVVRDHGFVSEYEVAALKAAGYTNETVLEVLVIAATKLISTYTNHIARTLLDGFMSSAEWTLPETLRRAG